MKVLYLDMKNKFKLSIKRYNISKIFIYIIEAVLGIVSSIFLGGIVQYLGWSFTINLIKMLETFGVSINLVGDPQSADPGAIIVATLYFLLSIIISYLIFKKTKYRRFSLFFCITSIFMSVIVFVVISTLIWF